MGNSLVLFASLLLAGMLAGCVGEVGHSSSDSDLVEAPPDTEPLAPLGTDAWRDAPAGCEGLLGMAEGLTFRVASARDGLIAALDVHGAIVCVDTVEAVQDELEEQGDGEQADELGDQYLVAVMVAAIPGPSTWAQADPTPQPNCGDLFGIHTNRQDPTPQPNTQPR